MALEFQRIYWFAAALLLPRRSLAAFERLPLPVLCWLRLAGTFSPEQRLPSEATFLVKQISRFEKAMRRTDGLSNISIAQIGQLHSMLCEGPESGRIRTQQVSLRWNAFTGPPAEFQPPDARVVRERLRDRIARHSNTPASLPASARFFWDFLNIHPFTDGNGRVARLISSIGLTPKNRVVFSVFYAEVMYRFKSVYHPLLKGYQQNGDWRALGQRCDCDFDRIADQVDRLENIAREFLDRLDLHGAASDIALEFFDCPVQTVDEYGGLLEAEKTMCCAEPECGVHLSELEINRTRYVAANRIVQALENLRPYANEQALEKFSVA